MSCDTAELPAARHSHTDAPAGAMPGTVSGVCAVVVAYQPDETHLWRLLRALRPQVAMGVVVHNGTPSALAHEARALGFEWLDLGANLGVAEAFNRGVAHAMQRGATFVLLSDQDSLPAEDMMSALSLAWSELVASGEPVGALGPAIVDDRTGSRARILQVSDNGDLRLRAVADGGVHEVAYVISSGCLVPLAALAHSGAFRCDLFIDYVDIEWCLRCRRQGLKVFVAGSARLLHNLGERVMRVFGREVPVHSSLRHYYVMRNSVALLRMSWVERGWKRYDAWVLMQRLVFHTLFSRPPGVHLVWMLRGLRDGWRGRLGPLRR